VKPRLLLNDQRGFTLIEAMVALMIATVGLIAMAELMAVTLRMQQLGRNSTSTSRLAQDKVDELNTVGFNDPQMACGGLLTDDVDNHNDRPAGATNYKRRWAVSAGPDGVGAVGDPQNALRTVTVRILPDVVDSRVNIQNFDLQTVIRWSGNNPVACP
jgi:prepilin-type N-terminal cleavage/methylation domain-containing protein